jgi:excinuclease UvrABC nuclease subunit
MNNEKLEQIKEQLASVPALPGCYLWKDKNGTSANAPIC